MSALQLGSQLNIFSSSWKRFDLIVGLWISVMAAGIIKHTFPWQGKASADPLYHSSHCHGERTALTWNRLIFILHVCDVSSSCQTLFANDPLSPLLSLIWMILPPLSFVHQPGRWALFIWWPPALAGIFTRNKAVSHPSPSLLWRAREIYPPAIERKIAGSPLHAVT